MTIRNAKLRGARAAAEVHEKLGIIDYILEGREQVDIFGALNLLDVPTLCRPLTGLLGAYINGESKGILVTSKRRLPIQRFTAAHELGHYWLKHEESIDTDDSIGLARKGAAGIPLQEIEAESFAAEFLLPKLLLVNTARRQGWKKSDLKNPEFVYQLALRTGVSYEATGRALLETGLIDFQAAQLLWGVTPKEIKNKVLNKNKSTNPWSDVFYVTERDDGAKFYASPEDTLVFGLSERPGSGYLWSGLTDNEGVELISDERSQIISGEIDGLSKRKIFIRGEGNLDLHLEEKRPWSGGGDPLASLDVAVDFNGSEEGLPRASR